MAYILRNELIGAPQITTVDQRYAPAEQAKSYSEANIRAYGAKSKFIELYNAAVMMPYLQGILAYFLIVSYPIACMLVILPGHYKGFFTWVSFFAWIKLWDVGFAMVHVVERSVWAMIGNHSHMAATARTLIATAKKVGGIGADPQYDSSFVGPLRTSLEAANAVPIVCSLAAGTVDGKCTESAGADQKFAHAFELFDKLLLTGANLDLDLSNGWYIYIMAALYTAVPAVTGQLVLGAKAGSASLVKDAFQGAANDGGQAAKTGAQHQAVNALQTNQKSLGQMAMAKALRKGTGADGQGPSLAMQAAQAGNKSLRENMQGAKDGLEAGVLGKQAEVAGKAPGNYERGFKVAKAIKGALPNALGGGGGEGGFMAVGNESAMLALGRRADEMGVNAIAAGQQLGAAGEGRKMVAGGLKDYQDKLGAQADFEAQSAAWEAKNEFASHASAMGGIAGMNAGNLSAGEKPQDTRQMGMYGMLDGYNSQGQADPNRSHSDQLLYSGNGYISEAQGLYAATDKDGSVMRDANGVTVGGGGWGASAATRVQGTWNETGRSHNAMDSVKRAGTELANPAANTGYESAGAFFVEAGKLSLDAADLKIDSPHDFNLPKQVDKAGNMHDPVFNKK
jgi:hypothetical protein